MEYRCFHFQFFPLTLYWKRLKNKKKLKLSLVTFLSSCFTFLFRIFSVSCFLSFPFLFFLPCSLFPLVLPSCLLFLPFYLCPLSSVFIVFIRSFSCLLFCPFVFVLFPRCLLFSFVLLPVYYFHPFIFDLFLPCSLLSFDFFSCFVSIMFPIVYSFVIFLSSVFANFALFPVFLSSCASSSHPSSRLCCVSKEEST